MNILIRMPNWIGDAVMATPALKNLKQTYPKAKFSLIASKAVAGLFENDPAIEKVIIDTSKQYKIRPYGIFKTARNAGKADLYFTFRNSFSCALMGYFTGSKKRVGTSRGIRDIFLTDAILPDKTRHQAEIYNDIVNTYLKTNVKTGDTSLFIENENRLVRKTVGINPGAAYGDAKRWEPEKFAEVATQLSKKYKYDIVILGSKKEKKMTEDISKILRENKIENFQNLAGKTTVYELMKVIASLSLFITNDSGPMHIAGAFKVPTIAIFGSTNHIQTSPWSHDKVRIVRKDMSCAPCMKRTCPLNHHNCMKFIMPDDVIKKVDELEG